MEFLSSNFGLIQPRLRWGVEEYTSGWKFALSHLSLVQINKCIFKKRNEFKCHFKEFIHGCFLACIFPELCKGPMSY